MSRLLLCGGLSANRAGLAGVLILVAVLAGAGQGLLNAATPVFLFAGQSNMAAYGGDYAAVPASPVDARVRYWWTVQGRPGDVANTSGGAWSHLQGVDWPMSDFPEGFVPDRFGPELGFARTLLASQPDLDLAIVKVQIGGSSMSDWIETGSFTPNGLQRLLGNAQAALTALESEGLDPYLAGLVWFQGESDTYTLESASLYGTDLETLVSTVRLSLDVPQLPVVILQTDFESQPGNLAMQQQQLQWATADGAAVHVPTADLPHLGDGVHFTGESILTIGERAAGAYRSEFSAYLVPEVSPAALALTALLAGVILRRRSALSAVLRNL